jgi:hypothetical protein
VQLDGDDGGDDDDDDDDDKTTLTKYWNSSSNHALSIKTHYLVKWLVRPVWCLNRARLQGMEEQYIPPLNQGARNPISSRNGQFLCQTGVREGDFSLQLRAEVTSAFRPEPTCASRLVFLAWCLSTRRTFSCPDQLKLKI